MIRSILAVAILVGIAVLSNFSSLLDVIALKRQNPELSTGVPAFDSRYSALRAALPKHATVGYLDTPAPSSQDALMEYYLTQYALSPVLVANDIEQKLIVGNFHSTDGVPALLESKHLAVVQDYGNGVMLLAKKTQ